MTGENKKTILLVEDEVLLAMSEKTALEKYGYNIIIANTGEEAIEIIKNTPDINLILMDIDLGEGIDGTEAAALILKEKEIPVVFCSSRTEPGIIEKIEKITSYGYVVKSSNNTVLDASIKMAFKLFDSNMKLTNELAIRKQMEEDLLKSKKSWQGIFNGITHPTLIIDPEHNILEINDRLREKVSKDISEIKKLKCWEIFHGPDSTCPPESCPFERMLISGTAETGEMEIESFDGHYIVTCTPLFDSNGNLEKVIHIATDITSRKLAENALLKSEEKYRNIIESSPVGIHQYELKNDGRLIFIGANSAADKILGVDNSIFIGKTIEDAFPPLADTEVPARYRDVAKTGIQWQTEQMDYVDDKIRGAFYVSAFRTGENTMAANFLDITAQKQAEESIMAAEALYQNLVETSQDLIWQCDSEGRYAYLNPAWEEISGYKIEEMLGKRFSDFQSPDMAERDRVEFAKLLQGNVVKGYETIHLGKNGKEVYLVFNAKFLKDKHGIITGTCGTAYDITERKIAENEIKKQLSEKVTLLKEVHHRIKNNISSMEGILALQAGSTDNTEVKVALQDSITRVQSIRVLYEKLLIGDDYQEIAIKDYIESLIDSFLEVFPESRKFIIEKNIEDFKLNAKEMIPVGIILNELITNIIKYAFVGRESGRVVISLDNVDNQVTLTIQDDGNGLPETFDVNNSTGFGLTIVRMLAQQLKGTFTIENYNGTRSILKFQI